LDAIHLDGLYAINPDGTMKWRFYTGKTVFHESPAIGSDGTIYLQSGSYTFAIGPLLTPPVAVAEPGIDVNGNLILDGSNSCDSDGTIISWNWALTNRDPAGNNFTLTGKTALIEGVDIGIYDVTLTVTDDDGLTGTNTAVLYVPAGVGVGVCPELQALLDNTKAALGITDEDQIVPAIIDLQNQVSTLTQQNADLTEENTKLKDEITELQNKIDQINNTLTVGLGSIETDFQSVFNDPDFIIPGDTLLEKFQALNQAVLDLNKGRKEGIYVNLGGKPGKGK
ncbi:MAG: PKD domain-containing protein, partial [Nitrospirota bacterium]